MNLDNITNFGLKQIDTAGYYLSRYGITDKVNRHNLIAIAMTEKEKLMGEMSRLELKTSMQRRRLQALRNQLEDQSEAWIAKAPKPIAKRLNKAKSLLIS
jgi:hypothetical protein